MKKMKKRSNGFTLTELAIVIAVIAILIAVLVPTFTSLINKAQESSDSQLVKNLNTALSVDETTNDKANTMSEALAVAAENGYNVDKLTPASSGDIVWDQESNRFLLINEDGEIVYSDSTTSEDVVSAKYQLWYVAKSDSDLTKGYSCYLDYTTEEVTATAGIDVGENTNVIISYSSSEEQSIVFYTNGGTLTIDNDKATVKHYGDAEVVNVKAVYNASYHPYGKITTVTIEKGRIYIEATAEIGTLNVTPSSGSTVIVDADSSATVSDVLLSDSSATESITFVSTALENMATSNIDSTTGQTLSTIGTTYFGGGYGTESSPFIISEFQHLENLTSFSNNQYYYYKQTENITVTNLDLFENHVGFSGVYDGNGKKITVQSTLENLDTVTLFYVKTSATIKDLTTVSAAKCLLSVATYGADTAYYIKLSSVTADAPESTVVKANESNISPFIFSSYYTTPSRLGGKTRVDLILENCINNVSLTNSGTCTGVFMGSIFYYTYSKDKSYPNGVEYYYTITNCTNNGNIYGNSQAGLLTGNYSGLSNSINGTYGGVYMTAEELSNYIKVTNVVNNGTISIMNAKSTDTTDAGIFSTYEPMNSLYSVSGTGTFTHRTNVISSDVTYSVSVDSNGDFYISSGTTDDSYTYQLAITLPNVISEEFTDGTGTVTGYSAYMGRTLNISLNTSGSNGTALSTSTTKGYAYTYEEAANVEAIKNVYTSLDYSYLFENAYYMDVYVGSDGTVYVILGKNTGNTTCPYFKKSETTNLSEITTFTIYAYDSNGMIVGLKTL